MGKVNNAELLKLRDLMRGVAGPEAAAARVELVAKLQEKSPDFSDTKINMSVALISSVAKEASDEEWIAFASTRKLPETVKLSPAQMEALRGGEIAVGTGLIVGAIVVE